MHRPLGRLVLAGLGWKAVGQVVGIVTRLVAGLIIARALGPREVGLAAMALTFAALGRAYADAGMGSALVQQSQITETDRSTAFWTTIAMGSALTALGVALATTVAAFFDEPRVAPLFALASAGFLVSALGATQSALLQRELRYRALETRLMVAGIAAGAAGAVLALAWRDAWAIVVQQVLMTTLVTVLLWHGSSWRPRRTFSRTSLRTLGAYSARLLGSRLFFSLHRSADNLIVGRALGSTALGQYGMAYNLMLLPFQRLVDPVRAVLFPALARVQTDRTKVTSVWLTGTRVIAAVLIPAMLGLAVVADDLVALALGDDWAPAGEVLRILAFVGVLQALMPLNSVVLSALGQARTLLRFSIVTFTLTVAGFLAGVQAGIDGVALGYLAANLVLVPAFIALTQRTLGLSLDRFARELGTVIAVGAGIGTAVAAVHVALDAAAAGAAARMIGCAAAGIAAWPAMLLVPALRRDLRLLWTFRQGAA